jgi:hypothetical protein
MTPFVTARPATRRRRKERTCRPLRGLQVGAASGEDEEPSRPSWAIATACFSLALSKATKHSLCLPMVRPLCMEALLGLFRATLVQFCIRRADHLIRRLLIVNDFLNGIPVGTVARQGSRAQRTDITSTDQMHSGSPGRSRSRQSARLPCRSHSLFRQACELLQSHLLQNTISLAIRIIRRITHAAEQF